ncbi:MAG: hypothetical protein Q9212_001022 [Teloschistes hypoglaucus]
MACAYEKVSIPLRICQLTFAALLSNVPAIVAGIIGQFLCILNLSRPLYGWLVLTEFTAGLSILLSLVLLATIKQTCVFEPVWIFDTVCFAAWIAAFAGMVDQINPVHCGELYRLDSLTHGDACDQWKVAVAFTFASGMVWLADVIAVRLL